MLDDVADCAADADQARWLMMTGLDYVVETAFLWRRCWTPKASVPDRSPGTGPGAGRLLPGLSRRVTCPSSSPVLGRWPPMSSPPWGELGAVARPPEAVESEPAGVG